ncbi:MAG TPA: hypothetical protein VMT30_03825 [Candidatus Saccharimonadia bacterium]|nr:hypothetical protein [Candidatus Saccharimonadia bacterium]
MQLYARTDQLKTQELKATLIDAVRSLNTEPAIDPQTGRRFIPSARVVFPARIDSHLYYRDPGNEPTLWLTDANNQSQAVTKVRTAESLSDMFKEVDALQLCSRQVVVSFNTPNPQDNTDKLTLKSTKKLKDGRIAYVYQNECPYGAEPLLRSVDQMESY